MSQGVALIQEVGQMLVVRACHAGAANLADLLVSED